MVRSNAEGLTKMLNTKAQRFAEVARIIAKGEPPEWLVQQLASCSQFIENGMQITPAIYRRYKKRIKRMQEAVDTLWEGLPSSVTCLGTGN
jgi:hypothetical protein